MSAPSDSDSGLRGCSGKYGPVFETGFLHDTGKLGLRKCSNLELRQKKYIIFLPHPRLAPAPDPTGVKILLARVSRVRIRVTVLASGHPRGRGAQSRFDRRWANVGASASLGRVQKNLIQKVVLNS